MPRALVLAAAVFVLAGCGGSSGSTQAPPRRAKPSPATTLPATYGGDFALRDQTGRLVRLSALRGKVVLVTFLYVHCPDVCPLIADNLNAVLRRLGPRRSRVRVLAVSVDPKGDTPAAVRAFVRGHRLLREFRYLVGTRAELARVWRAYKLSVLPSPDEVAHSAYVFLVDPRGRSKYLYPPTVAPSVVTRDVRKLLSPA